MVSHIVITPFKVNSYLSVSLSSLALGLTIIIILTLFSSAVWTTVAANAQIFHFTHTNSASTTATVARHLSTLQQQQQGQPNLHLVKITSPIKGQTVPVGKDLRISGSSTANATTSNCSVSVIVNGIGRYHDASPNGTSSHNDYSKWNFTLTPSYTAIKQGQNKITSKFSCIKDPTAISHYSVNVTGVTAGLNSTGTSPVSSNSTIPVSSNSTHPVTSKATIPVTSKSTSASLLTGKNNNQVLSVSLRLDKNSLHPGDKQTITISVHDKNSSNPIAGASVIGKITSPVGPFKKVGGITDEKGKASYSWKVSYVDTTGKYKLTTEVSSPGYQKYSTSKTFKVTPVAAIVPYDNYITSTPADNANNPPVFTPTIIPSTPADNTNTDANNNNNNNNNHHNHRNHLPAAVPSSAADNANNNNNPPPPPPPPPTIIPSNPADNTNTDANNNNNNNNKHLNPPSNTIPSNTVLSPPETNAKINFDNSHQSIAVPNPDNANVHSSKDLQSHQLITIPSISGVTISNSSTIPSTNSPVTIPNNMYNNNVTPSPANPSINIPPTNSPVTIPNNIYNNNNPPPSLTAPSSSVIPKTGDKTPFLLPFH